MLTDLDKKVIRYTIVAYFCVRFIYMTCFLGAMLFLFTGFGLSNTIIFCTAVACYIEFYLVHLLEKYKVDFDELVER